MSSLALSPPPSRTAPHRLQSKTTAPTTQRKVYGKRKADAPRAVFDQRSPTRDLVKSLIQPVEEVVEEVEEKLAQIKLEEPESEDRDPGIQQKQQREEQANEDTTPQGNKVQKQILQQSLSPTRLQSPVLKHVTRRKRAKNGSKSKKVKDLQILDTESQSTAENHETQLTSPKVHSRKSRTQYETMVEVRIPLVPETKLPASSIKNEEPKKLDSSSTATGISSTGIHSNSLEEQKASRQTRKKKTASRVSSGCIQDEKASAYVRSILDEAMSPIAAQGVQKFVSWATRSENMFEVVKLAEGSYGEVYKLRLREDICMEGFSESKLARLKAYGEGVFKVVPLRAQSGPGSKKFTSVEEIVAEIKMLKYLDPIPGFARFREIHVVQGRFPESFQTAWNYYKQIKDDCFNPNPSNKRAYPDAQLWAILEMDDAGCELEKFSWSSIFQVYDIFWGVAMALARAEEYAQFEHRDLHMGNVCIRSTRPDGCMDAPADIDVTRLQTSSGFGLSTLETTIIDYSLSRAELLLSKEPDAPLEVTSSDLDKKQIFDAIGQDEDEVLLRDTYRYMRAQLYKGVPLDTAKTPDVPGIWAEYAPRTNLIWLLFLLKNLLKHKKPEPSTKTTQTSQTPQRLPLMPRSPNKNMGRSNRAKGKSGKLETEKPLVKQIQVAAPKTQVDQLKKTLETRLQSVLELLDLEHGHEDMCCAADLVAYAIDHKWLQEDDFFT